MDEPTKQINEEKDNQPEEEGRRKKNLKNEDSVNSLWDNLKRFNIHIIGEEKGKGKDGEEKEQKIGDLLEK